MFLVRYYNNNTPVYYDYSDTDTVESFFAMHPEIGDQEICKIYAGPKIYLSNSQDSIHSVVENMEAGKAAIAFPQAIVISITYINIYGQKQTNQFTISYTQKQYMLVDDVRAHFGIHTDMECEFSSDNEACLPENVYEFNFETTEFYLKEVCKN